MENNTIKKVEEIMKDVKAIMATELASASTADLEDNIAVYSLLAKSMDLVTELSTMQIRLMDKLDVALEKYLKS